jgi:hypothetical protein
MTVQSRFVHDMKNQLGIIIGFTNLLLDDMASDDPRRADLDEVRKAGEAALAILNGWNVSVPPEELK